MYLDASTIKWCHTIKYLGVTLLSGPHMKVDIDVIKRKFFLQVVILFLVTAMVRLS